ncbi:DUF397 domain-containing protein [Streptomyces acidiscabies]|uniref:DUF397 domain-containing protein n=1 Tax=Streptomyces acidiscabies TaxID=42234 RepID=UPI00095366A5|nr:DUF397 domain-containing protein [Streptomyces acidiscabies]GAV40720.1 hypothetical protein Saa2_03615 [Streptomyces acidiscabies]
MNRIDLTDAAWIKSSRSNGQAACVEVAFIGQGAVPVRDSKNAYGPILVASETAWGAFVEYVKH